MHFPLHLYFSEDNFKKEYDLFFKKYCGFVATANLVPNSGDYYVVPHTNDSKVLVNKEGEYRLLGNVCRHRQAKLLEGRGTMAGPEKIVCPIHRWAYDLEGQLVSAPHFHPKPDT